MPQYFRKATISDNPGKGLGPYYTDDEWADAQARIEALEWLARFAKHGEHCPARIHLMHDGECNCGLEAARAAAGV